MLNNISRLWIFFLAALLFQLSILSEVRLLNFLRLYLLGPWKSTMRVSFCISCLLSIECPSDIKTWRQCKTWELHVMCNMTGLIPCQNISTEHCQHQWRYKENECSQHESCSGRDAIRSTGATPCWWLVPMAGLHHLVSPLDHSVQRPTRWEAEVQRWTFHASTRLHENLIYNIWCYPKMQLKVCIFITKTNVII